MMKGATVTVTISLVVLFCTATCQGYFLTVLPETVVAIINNQAHFHCASSSNAIYWEVDGIEARMVQIQDRGITFVTTNGGTTSVLTVDSSATNNNTEVVCVALNVGNGETVQRSSIAYLIVQGLLAAPSNVSITYTNLTAIHLSWNPPFTHNITNADENILFYTIRIANHDTGVVSFANSTYPGYTMLSMKAFQCDAFEFQVTAWNSAGEGNISNTVNAAFKKPLTLNSPIIMNVTANNSVQLYCNYVCISNTLAVWFIGGRLERDVKSDQILVRKASNRLETCGSPAAIHTEILEITPLIVFDHPIPVYCAYILVCNKDDLVGCTPKTCFSDLVVELQVIKNQEMNTETPITEMETDITQNTMSSLSEINLYGIVATLVTSLTFNVLIIAVTFLLLMIFICMRIKRRMSRASSRAPKQTLYTEEGAIYDQVQGPPHQEQLSSEVTTEACPAYHVTFFTK